MTTLHIEHPITDYTVWKAAFDRFEGMRQQAGVKHHRVHRPEDDPAYVMVQLDFASSEEATAFLAFLRTNVWSSPQNAPALVGTPLTRILEMCEEG
jgi:hypothetical protein